MKMKINLLKYIIIGNGSIGRKHFKILKDLGLEASIISSRKFFLNRKNNYLKNVNYKKTIFFICNNTHLHFKTLKKVAHYKARIFMEKPLISNSKEVSKINKLIKKYNLKIFTGYIFRSDPRILKLKTILENKLDNVLLATFNLQTYMPSWHKGENYISRYPNKKELGGGVLLTCSHEIDTAINLFGNVKKFFKKIKSVLNNDVENSVLLILTHHNGIVSLINLDFSNHIQNKRTLEVKTTNCIYKWDFNKKYLIKKTKNNLVKIPVKKFKNFNEVYINQTKNLIKNFNSKKKERILDAEKIIFNAKKIMN